MTPEANFSVGWYGYGHGRWFEPFAFVRYLYDRISVRVWRWWYQDAYDKGYKVGYARAQRLAIKERSE